MFTVRSTTGRTLAVTMCAATAFALIARPSHPARVSAQTDPTPTMIVAEPTATPDYHATATTAAYVLATTIAERDTARRNHEAAYNEAWRLAQELYALQTSCPNGPRATPLPFTLALPYAMTGHDR